MKRMALLAALSICLLSLGAPVLASDALVSEAVRKSTYVLAEFVSKTCPVCREMRPMVEAAVARHHRVVHQIHDADAEPELAEAYKVRCVPVYVVVDPTGKVRFNDVGPRTPEELDKILREAGVKRR